jgi:DNA-binding response OmpR family regulator
VSASGARATVVVANPDDTVREVLARIVESGGHEAVRTAEAERVAEAVGASLPQGAVLDLGAGTVDAVRAIRGDGSPVAGSVRIVAVATGPANAVLAWQAGADAVLVRPFAADALRAELGSVLTRTESDRVDVRAAALANPPS